MPDKRTYADRAEYLKQAVSKRRRQLREKALQYLGSQCIICGYKKCKASLEFHHRDPKLKEFGISMKGLTRSWEKTVRELNKCVLLCANCHREVHTGISQLPRESGIETSWDNGEAHRP